MLTGLPLSVSALRVTVDRARLGAYIALAGLWPSAARQGMVGMTSERSALPCRGRESRRDRPECL